MDTQTGEQPRRVAAIGPPPASSQYRDYGDILHLNCGHQELLEQNHGYESIIRHEGLLRQHWGHTGHVVQPLTPQGNTGAWATQKNKLRHTTTDEGEGSTHSTKLRINRMMRGCNMENHFYSKQRTKGRVTIHCPIGRPMRMERDPLTSVLSKTSTVTIVFTSSASEQTWNNLTFDMDQLMVPK